MYEFYIGRTTQTNSDLKNLIKTKSITTVTTVNGGINTGLSRNEVVVIGGFVISHSDKLVIPTKFTGNFWGITIHNTTKDLAALESTEVSVIIYYVDL